MRILRIYPEFRILALPNFFPGFFKIILRFTRHSGFYTNQTYFILRSVSADPYFLSTQYGGPHKRRDAAIFPCIPLVSFQVLRRECARLLRS